MAAFFIIPHTVNSKKERQAILDTTHYGHLTPEEMKDLIQQSLDADKAFEIATIDLRGESAIADFMIIASGTSSRHVAALAEKLRDRLSVKGVENIRLEGAGQSDWVVVDAGDIIVHLFRPEVRSFYNIEKMWSPYNGMEIVSEKVTA